MSRTVVGSRALVACGLVVVALLVAGCSQKYQAEGDGKDLGQAVCDLYDASTQEEADAAVEEIRNQLDDLSGSYTIVTAEDRADIDENLADFAEQRQPCRSTNGSLPSAASGRHK